MKIMSYIVLEENLIRELFTLFYLPKSKNANTIQALCQYLKPFYVTIEQLSRIGLPDQAIQAISSTRGLWQVISNSDLGFTSTPESTEKLHAAMIQKSKLKVMLTTQLLNLTFPTINILDKAHNVKSVYSGRFSSLQDRKFAIEHLKHLINSAQHTIVFRDKYLDEKNFNEILNKFITMTSTSIHIYIDGAKKCRCNRKSKFLSTARAKGHKNIIHVYRYKSKKEHDRYIRIDDSFEILISSGFEHIFSTKKDFTYTIHPIN